MQETGVWIFNLVRNPWLLLVAIAAPLLLLLFTRRIYPSPRAAMLATFPFAMSILLPWFPTWWWSLVLTADTVVIALAILDLFTLPNSANVSVTRSMQRVASLNSPHPAELIVDNRNAYPVRMRLTDDASEGLVLTPSEHDVSLPPNKRVTLNYTIASHRRGAFRLESAFALIGSRGGIWVQRHVFPCAGDLHVYPDIKQIAEYALLARTNRLSLIGVRRTKRAGQENDFERLRDYQQDDTYKHIDWRSTARRQKLTVKQFQTDQSQRVIFMLDCGRMMTNEHEGLSLLDYSLNAALMLSYVALDQGDSVGMVCFSDHVQKYVPPAGGKHQMNRLLHAGFDQFPKLVQSRFDEAFLYLSKHCRRRSLVVLISNVIDQVNANQIQDYMGNLVGAHLPLVVLLRDHRIFQAADNPALDPQVFYRSAAASQLLVWRHNVIHRMKAGGSLTLDVFPEEMTRSLVNQYLDIKARHML